MRCIATKLFVALFVGCFSVSAVFAAYGLADVKDVRVAPIIESQWSVGDFGGGRAFNLYTEKNYPCSCGVVAFAQIMRQWRMPSGTVAPKTYKCWLEEKSLDRSTKGGSYDWNAMPLKDEDCTTDVQREALGHLAYDLGVASHVAWVNSTYSYTSVALSVAALQEYFGYVSARTLMKTQGFKGANILQDEDCRNAILGSLDAGMPVVIGLKTNDNRGHLVIVDGYGFDDAGNLLCHVNFGWKGAADLWYNLIANSFVADGGDQSFTFSQIDEIAYNIHPTKVGDVISGRVLDSAGNPVANISVVLRKSGQTTVLAESRTNEKGIYSLRYTDKSKYVISADDEARGHAEQTVDISKVGANVVLDSSSLNFAVAFSTFQLRATSVGSVGNLWGKDLVLGSSSPTHAQSDGPLFLAATTLDGYLAMADGKMVGTIQVKAGKAGKTGESKLTASVMIDGQSKKLSFKGNLAVDGTASLTCNGQPDLRLSFDEKSMSGKLGSIYNVIGMRNLFMSKNKTEVDEANRTLQPWLGALNVAWDGGCLTATIAAKGKVKITGTIGDKKVSANSQILLGEAHHVIPVLVMKPMGLAFMLELPATGSEVNVWGLDACKAGKVGALRSNAKFHVDVLAELWNSLQGTVLVDQLPDGQPVVESGGKWNVDKAGKVVYQKGTVELDETKLGKNPSALKLTYKAKDGTFKGSFKAYSDVNGKLKATTVNVTGVLIADKGYGSATIKKVGSVPVTVE